MMHRLAALLLCVSAISHTGVAQVSTPSAPIKLRAGMVITSSVKIARDVYALRASASLDSALIVVRGSNITVDFDGAELRGADLSAMPDEARGVAIRIEGGRNVRVINAKVRGYHVAVMARNTRGLTLANNDFSYNWKPRLFSLVEHESLVDWMSFHHNEKREWLRFGAGIYLEGVKGGDIRDNIVEQSSNGLLLTQSDSLTIQNNSFSFNSAQGVGLYRSTYNTIVNNRIDYNVRGYSHGFFRRGQDSAGLLMYEQSGHNMVTWNSVTHSGDGLFLWAGQSTMDTGKGGANDNLFYANDFSFAPTNGMEATFSRNDFIGNRIEGSDHGLWGGYSYGSKVIGNCFQNNRIGIAIEHGQDNVIGGNRFDGDTLGVSLWANAIEPSDWGYPKNRDTKSRDWHIRKNTFAGVREHMKILNTSTVDTLNNEVESSQSTSCEAGTIVPIAERGAALMRLPRTIGHIPVTAASRLKRDAIVVDEWGPFDWRSPKLWPLDSTHARPMRFRVLGPPGTWRVLESPGLATVSKTSGNMGDTIYVTPRFGINGQSVEEWSLNLEYRGEATQNPRGERTAAGMPVRFSYGAFAPTTDWNAKFYVWADSTDPRNAKTADAFAALLRGKPLLTRTESRLDYMWYRPTIKELPQTKYAAVATTVVTLPDTGAFTLRTISDDAVRVWVDDQLVIDNWVPHESAVNNAVVAGGSHQVRVQYVQVEGWSELRVEFVRGVSKSQGSAGPH